MAPRKPGRAALPLIWALLGRRAGDNAQVEALAEALGWPWQAKRLTWRRPSAGWTPLHGRMGPSLATLAPAARRQLTGPPWPDLVISVGWRSAPVARWIGRQSGAALAHVGRPRAPLAAFDVVLTTPQYRLPDAPNVVRLDGPLTRPSAERAAVAATWRARFDHLPRPWIAALVGGDGGGFRLTPPAAAALGRRLTDLVRRRGGALLVVTSPRTPRAAGDALVAHLDAADVTWIWRGEEANPYAALLGLADEFVVTIDSVSMAHEAALTGRPLHLAPLPQRSRLLLRMARRLDDRLRRHAATAGAYTALLREGWLFPPRRIDLFQTGLVDSGRAAWLGDEPPTPPPVSADADRERAVAAVRRALALG